MNAFILWTSLALGGGALIWLMFFNKGVMVIPSYTMYSANVVGGQPSPYWPAIPLVIACGALSGFHSLVGSGTSSKQLANELHGLFVAYGGMETEGFLSTMVIGSIGAFGVPALADAIGKSLGKAKVLGLVNKIAAALNVSPLSKTSTHQDIVNLLTAFIHNPNVFGKYYTAIANTLKWTVIPRSYAYATYNAFGLDLTVMTIFGAIWITGFALTSLDTATRLGRYAWQELMEPLKTSYKTAYRILADKWVAALILAGLGIALAWGGSFLTLWPAFAGMNQLLSSLALMTVAVWVSKVQKATAAGKALVVAPAIFMWITVTLALIGYDAAVVPALMAKGGSSFVTGIVVGTITAIGVGLNLYLFALWYKTMRKPAIE
jgi:carbon starvation protein